jgi:hypothetical protein
MIYFLKHSNITHPLFLVKLFWCIYRINLKYVNLSAYILVQIKLKKKVIP